MAYVGYVPPPPVLLESLDYVTQGVLVAGPDSKIVFCNAAFRHITGFAIEDVLGRTCRFLQGMETDPATITAIAERLRAGQAFSGEILNYRKNGEPFWNDLTISPVHDADGGIAYFIGIQRDVTARKQEEAKWRATAEHHKHLFDNMLAGIVVHAADTRILYANATATRLLGTHQDTILGAVNTDPRWGFLRPDGTVMPIEEYPVNRAVATGDVVKHLVLGLRRSTDGVMTWLMCDAHPIPDGAGGIKEVVVNFTEITDLKQAKQALTKSEERLRLVLRGSTDAPFDWEIGTGESYYSPRWWDMLGYEENELTANQDLWRTLLHPEDRDAAESSFAEILRGSLESYEMEFRLLHKKGHYVPVLSRGFVKRDSDGRPMRVSGTNTDLTERKRAEEKIHQLANYDPLTELPNRRLLMIQLQHALLASGRSGRLGAVLFIDLDNFKMLNDTLGHARGDQLLQQVASRLRGAVRASDMVARLGGDEFLVMLEDLAEQPQDAALQADLVGEKLLSACNLPYSLDGVLYHSTPSIGITLFDGETKSVDELLKQADLAMYHAKSTGRNASRFYDASMQVSVDRRMEMEKGLREGLDRNEMILHYQPQVDRLGQVVGAEALVRWQHPLRGLVSPAEFIPLAEQTGLILKLGKWVLRTACETLREWERHPALAGLTLSVNVSARQLHEPDFVEQVLAVVTETGASPFRLKLELTESMLAEDTEITIARMAALREHGIGFVLDDFGTGYSSLSYLQRMPLDQLKIDKCFVADVPASVRSATIARIIITLAETLGLTVVAEGVETQEQKHFLAENGCTMSQGYLFGKPMPLNVFEARVLDELQPLSTKLHSAEDLLAL